MILVFFLIPLILAVSSVPLPAPSSIIDVLSADVQYSYFLRHLQKLGLVPLINSLENITVLAPINSAYASDRQDESLTKYLINQPFSIGELGVNDIVFNTLYNNYPIIISPDFKSKEYTVDYVASFIELDIYAKHQHSYIHAIDHLLPPKPSICDFLLDDDLGSISIFKQLIISVFHKSHHKKLTVPSCDSFFNSSKTLLIPTNDFLFNSLPNDTLNYYLTLHRVLQNEKFSLTKDAEYDLRNSLLKFIKLLMIPDLIAGVNGTDNETHRNLNGNKFNFNWHNNSLTVNNLLSTKESFVLSNGAVHIFDKQNGANFFISLKLPIKKLSPRDLLYSLHYSNFVRELKFRKLLHLIDSPHLSQTVFLNKNQRDDIVKDELFEVASFNQKQSLLYQFANESIDINDYSNSSKIHKLLNSKMCSSKRIGSCFKLKFLASTSRNSSTITINDENKIAHGPFKSNQTFIYIVDSEIETPSSFKHTMGPLISSGFFEHHLEHIKIDKESCLTTLGYLNKFDLFHLDDNYHGYSIFLPCGITNPREEGELTINKASKGSWNSLGLILDHLKSNPYLFKDLLKGFFIEDLIYSDFGLDDNIDTKIITRNLRGDLINVSESYYNGEINHRIKLNLTELSIPLNSDVLFNQGVVHIINRVLFPENFHVSLYDLIQTTIKDSKFSFLKLLELYPNLLKKLGLLGKDKDKFNSSKYSLLIPTSESLKDFNITSNFDNLLNFLQFHLIPNNQLDPLLDCITSSNTSSHFKTKTNLTDTQLVCSYDKSNNKYFLRLDDDSNMNTMGYNKDHEVVILSHGCTSIHRNRESDLSCVFLIDKPLNLSWLQKDDGFLHIHLGFISIGIGIILGLILFGTVMLSVIVCLGASNKSKNSNGIHTDFSNTPGQSFMRVTSDEEEPTFDHGYETDDDMLRTEREQLLPIHGKKRKKGHYGSINQINSLRDNNGAIPTNSLGNKSAPRTIRSSNNIRALNRDFNLPGA